MADGARNVEVQFNRFIGNERVSADRIIEGWGEPTFAAAAGRHVLAIQDTSNINIRTTDERRRGLGEVGKGHSYGVLLHPMLSVDAETGSCLGLATGTVWTRKGRVTTPHGKRKLTEKESSRWIDTAKAAKSALAAAKTVTMVADREADFFTLWALVPDRNVHVLGRVHYDRPLVGGAHLTTIAGTWELADTRHVSVRERPDRPERVAELQIRYGAVTIKRPRKVREPGVAKQITLNLVDVIEVNQPDGVEPLHWMLITTHLVDGIDKAWKIVGWYQMRWIIEQFFRTLKAQGFGIEQTQVWTADRIIKLVAIAAHAAVITMQMVQARDGISAEPALIAFTSSQIVATWKCGPRFVSRFRPANEAASSSADPPPEPPIPPRRRQPPSPPWPETVLAATKPAVHRRRPG